MSPERFHPHRLIGPLAVFAGLAMSGDAAAGGKRPQQTQHSVATADRFILNAHNDRGLQREGEIVREEHLPRYQNAADIGEAIRRGQLVRVPDHGFGFQLDPGLGHRDPKNWQMYRYARPDTLAAIEELGRKFRLQFQADFTVTSLVRSCEYQARLQKGNQNAVACADTSHISGTTFDARYSSMRPDERTWFEHQLAELERQGRVQATKEVGPSQCYHAMVYPKIKKHDREDAIVRR